MCSALQPTWYQIPNHYTGVTCMASIVSYALSDGAKHVKLFHELHFNVTQQLDQASEDGY